MKITTRTPISTQSFHNLNHHSAPDLVNTEVSSSRPRQGSGFTLVETVVAILLGAIMISALYGGIVAGFSMVQVSRENLRATQILLQRVEAVRLSSYTTLQDAASYPTNSTEYFCPSGKPGGTAGVAYTVTYNWASAPSSLPPSYRNDVMLVTVGVSWKSGKVQRARSMQTYVARHGIQSYVASN